MPFLKDLAPLLAELSPGWLVLALAVAVLSWQSPKLLSAFLTHRRESKRFAAEEARKQRKFDLDVQAKLEKINAKKPGVKQ